MERRREKLRSDPPDGLELPAIIFHYMARTV